MGNCKGINENIFNEDDIEEVELDSNNVEFLDEYIRSINTSNIKNVQYDNQKFQSGITKMSKICGMITALVNVGITPNDALSYISERNLNKQGTDATLEITKIQADANVAASRYGLENSQKNII